ncbi:hypothetical protein KIN20_027363 [Parelaphostrongylus tenuis]|uniref:H15 domain-containing protein n=1 Tax=Parelaphostrongylus tenuis TaxID=148309 RepID=A0AAD5QZ83_PARTN|nr:hypothetical protein KIN20_027363 [Parelaphostrongylus tenuis]
MSTDVETDQMRVVKVVSPFRLHPPYPEMVRQAISELQNSSDSSRAAIQRYIVEHYPLGNNDNLRKRYGWSFKLAEGKENKVSSLRDKKLRDVNIEKTKPAGFENKGPTSVKKSNVEKKAKTPAPVKPTAKKSKATGTPNAVEGAKHTYARPKSIKKAPASDKEVEFTDRDILLRT